MGEPRESSSGPPFTVDVEAALNGEPGTLFLSDYGEEITYIPLQTDGAVLLDGNLDIGISDTDLFIKDSHGLHQFDRTGNYIRQIGKNGRGPGEYIMAFDFALVPESQEVCLLAFPSKEVMVFDVRSGELKRSFLPKDPKGHQMLEFPRGNLVFHIEDAPWEDGDERMNELYFTNLFGETLDSLPRRLIREKSNVSGRSVAFYTRQEELYFMSFLTDTLFRLTGEGLPAPHAVFHQGRYRTDPEIVLTPEVMDASPDLFFLSRVFETDDDFFVTVLSDLIKDQKLLGVYSKSGNSLIFLPEEAHGLTNDLDGGFPFWPIRVCGDSLLVGYADAYRMLEYMQTHPQPGPVSAEFRDMVASLQEDSNPVVMVVEKK